MSDGIEILGSLCVFGALFLFIIWSAWRAYSPRGLAMYILFLACIPIAVAFAVHSTLPSSAARRQVRGRISHITTHQHGRSSSSYTIDFKTDSGLNLKLDAAAIPLFFAEGRDEVEVTYLDEKPVARYPRVIEFRALSGPRAGEANAVSADWLGPWLGVPISAVIGIAAIFGANRNKRVSREKGHA